MKYKQPPIKICYKKDSKGKIRITEFYLYSDGVLNRSGLLHGKLKETFTPCKPKNIGRSNETTSQQQSLLELESRYKKKLDEGYFETIEEAENNIVILPMLAKSVVLETLKFPVITSPKLDGMRCMGQADIENVKSFLMSRKGKWIDTLDHITVPLIQTTDGIVFDAWLDGELYSHGDDFQTNMSLIKKYKKGETEKIKYHVYDIYIPNVTLTYRERHKILSNSCNQVANIEVVPYLQAHSVEELKAIHQDYLNQGYEGTMVRIDEIPYELNKRSSSLLKYKDFIDETYKIVDIVPNEKTPTQGTVVCELNTKKWYTLDSHGFLSHIANEEFRGAKYGYPPFKCGMKMSHEERRYILVNKDEYIGQTAEVRYFEYSNLGVPRFPICVGMRLDK